MNEYILKAKGTSCLSRHLNSHITLDNFFCTLYLIKQVIHLIKSHSLLTKLTIIN